MIINDNYYIMIMIIIIIIFQLERLRRALII